jgi:peptidoglycan hydrolase FlgJ
MSEIGKLNSIKAAPMAEKSNKVTEEKFREVADLYENHFIREMMKQMRSTVHEGGFIQQNNAEKIFRDQLDDQYADQWGKAGGIGLSGLIYDQLLNKYGPQMGLKQIPDKPVGPINLDQKSNFTGVMNAAPKAGLAAAGEPSGAVTFKFQSPENEKLELKSPWAGTLLERKYMDMDQMQYRIKHDNGLESLIMTRGTGLGPEQKLAVGDSIAAGQQLGWVSSASPLLWTVKPNVSE